MHGYSLLGRGKLLKWIKCSHAFSLLEYKVRGNPLLKALSKPLALIPENLAVPYPSEDLFYAIYWLKE
jgi:hypothetical protein